MSKTNDLLKWIERKRSGTLHTAEESKVRYEEPKGAGPIIENIEPTRPFNRRLIELAVFVLMILLLGVSIKLFLTVRQYGSEANAAIAKLNKIEELVGDSAKKMDVVSSDIARLNEDVNSTNLKIADISAYAKRLGEAESAHGSAIENLSKAHNALSDKTSSLETELSKITSKDK